MPFIPSILQSIYHFKGAPRLGWGWENPNIAAAVLATYLPFSWYLTDRAVAAKTNLRRILSCILEGVIAACICWTYSRGGIVSIFCSLIVYTFFNARFSASDRPFGGIAIFRAAVVLSLCCMSGLNRRFIMIGESDGSVAHRLEIWRAAIQLFSARPITGWGLKTSGLLFSQWFQSPISDFHVSTAVNSFLYIAVELGAAALTILLAILLLPTVAVLLINPNPIRRNQSRIFAVYSATSTAFIVSSLFTTTFNQVSVIVFVIPLFVLFGIHLCRHVYYKEIIYYVLSSACVAFFASVLLYATGFFINACNVPSLSYRKNEIFLIKNRDFLPVAFLPDYRCLSPLYGKALRKILTDSIKLSGIVVYEPGRPVRDMTESTIVCFGPRYKELKGIPAQSHVLIVAPVGSPAALGVLPHQVEAVLIPALDEFLCHEEWCNWCVSMQVRAIPLAACGQDVSSHISEVLRLLTVAP